MRLVSHNLERESWVVEEKTMRLLYDALRTSMLAIQEERDSYAMEALRERTERERERVEAIAEKVKTVEGLTLTLTLTLIEG